MSPKQGARVDTVGAVARRRGCSRLVVLVRPAGQPTGASHGDEQENGHTPIVTWDAYLDSFHAVRPGITEAILRRTRDGGTDPFLDSLYLPGLSTRHYRLARAYLRLLGGCHLEVPVPLRRIIAEYPGRGPDRT